LFFLFGTIFCCLQVNFIRESFLDAIKNENFLTFSCHWGNLYVSA
jgi:hypothetical protein